MDNLSSSSSFLPSSCLSNGSSSHNLPSTTTFKVGMNIELSSLSRLSSSPENLVVGSKYDYSDAEIEVEGITIGVHRCILAARCPFFDELFKNGNVSSVKEGKPKYLVSELVPHWRVEYEAFMVILNYLYTDKVKEPPPEVSTCIDRSCDHDACVPAINYAMEMVYASATFRINELVMVFERSLLNCISKIFVEDAIPILMVAYHFQLKQLLSHCVQRIALIDVDDIIIEKEFPHEVVADIKSLRVKFDREPEHDSAQVNYFEYLSRNNIKKIYRALDSKDVEQVKLLIDEANTSLDATFALHYAAAYCNLKTFDEVQKLGCADINLKNSRGYTVLHIAARRKDPSIVLRVLQHYASALDKTKDGRTAVTIRRRLTRPKDFREAMMLGKETNMDRICIDLLEREMCGHPFNGNMSMSSMMKACYLHKRLLHLEKRVAMARFMFPVETRLAMHIADADSTSEFAGLSTCKGSYCNLREFDLNELPSEQVTSIQQRLQALQKAVETDYRFFPNCSEVLDRFLEDDTLVDMLLEKGSPEEQRMKRMRCKELRADVMNAFNKDIVQSCFLSSSSCSSSPKGPYSQLFSIRFRQSDEIPMLELGGIDKDLVLDAMNSDENRISEINVEHENLVECEAKLNPGETVLEIGRPLHLMGDFDKMGDVRGKEHEPGKMGNVTGKGHEVDHLGDLRGEGHKHHLDDVMGEGRESDHLGDVRGEGRESDYLDDVIMGEGHESDHLDDIDVVRGDEHESDGWDIGRMGDVRRKEHEFDTMGGPRVKEHELDKMGDIRGEKRESDHLDDVMDEGHEFDRLDDVRCERHESYHLDAVRGEEHDSDGWDLDRMGDVRGKGHEFEKMVDVRGKGHKFDKMGDVRGEGHESDGNMHSVHKHHNELSESDPEESMSSDSDFSDEFVDSDCEICDEDDMFDNNIDSDVEVRRLSVEKQGSVGMSNEVPTAEKRRVQRQMSKKDNPILEVDECKLELGMEFPDTMSFKDAVKKHSIRECRDVQFTLNHKLKVQAKCKHEKCPWVIYASKVQNEDTIVVKTYVETHKCPRSQKVSHATPKFLAKIYNDRIKSDPNWPIESMISIIQKDIKLEFKKWQIYRAKKIAYASGSVCDLEQYGILWAYAEEIRRSNPGTTVKIKSKSIGGSNQFKRLYICWGALKRGFLDGCRPVICLDGCHLKTHAGGILLSAVGIDSNNGIYPFAYAIVDKKKKNSWLWFLELLIEDLHIQNPHYFTIMSDKQKGLIDAVEQLLPGCEHRFCVQNLYGNFKQVHKGLALKNLFWKAAKATRVEDFNVAMAELKNRDLGAYEWLVQRPASDWSKAHFSCHSKCDILLNNLSKRFNALILGAINKPIVTMLEEIRLILMKRVHIRRDEMMKHKGDKCPQIEKLFDDYKRKAMEYVAHWNGCDEFEIEVSIGKRFRVHIKERRCVCRKWELTGIPCPHAISAFYFLGLTPEDFVDNCYDKGTYLKTYSHVMGVLNACDMWPKVECEPLIPPVPSKFPGRLKKTNMKSAKDKKKKGAEERLGKGKNVVLTKMPRKGLTMTCKTCHKPNHNSRACPLMNSNTPEFEVPAANQIKKPQSKKGSKQSDKGKKVMEKQYKSAALKRKLQE